MVVTRHSICLEQQLQRILPTASPMSVTICCPTLHVTVGSFTVFALLESWCVSSSALLQLLRSLLDLSPRQAKALPYLYLYLCLI